MTFKRVLNNLQPGTYAIRVKAVGSSLLDSEWSAVFTVQVTGDTTPPPVPSAPTVSQSLAGINISWIDPSYDIPVDFAGVEVYSSEDSYITPIGLITVQGGFQPFATQEYETTYRFKFKAVDRSGNKSSFSAESNAISPAKLVESDVTAGILDFEEIPYKDNGNFVSDGSFETTARQNALTDINTSLKVSFGTSGAFLGSGSLNILSGGLNQDIYLMGNPSAPDFVNKYPIIVNPSDVYLGRLAVKNQSGSSATVALKMRVYKTDLTTSDLTLVTQSVTSSSSWQPLIVNTAQANRVIPANGYAAQIFITSTQQISIDAVEVRQVIGTALIQDAAITNAQIQDATIQNAKIAFLDAGLIRTSEISGLNLNESVIISSASRLQRSITGATAYGTGSSTITYTANSHGFSIGQTVEVSGVTPSSYNKTGIITNITDNTFTISVSPNGSNQTYSSGGLATNQNIITFTSNNHGFVSGQTVVVSGVNPSSYNQTSTISSTTTNTFTTIFSTPVSSTYSSGGTATIFATISGASYNSTLGEITYTTSHTHGFLPGYTATITNVSPSGYNISGAITKVTTNTFSILSVSNPGTYSSNGRASLSTSVLVKLGAKGSIFAGNSATSGARILLDVNGLRAFNSSNVNTVNISSDGSASFTGSLTATTGTFTGFMTAGQIRIGSGVSGSNNGIHNAATGDYIYDNGLVRLGNGAILYNGSTLTINANGTFSGSLSSGISISSPVISGGSITGSTLNIGSGTFQVNSSGALTASSATLTGRLTLPTGSDTIRFLSGATTVGTIDNYFGSGINVYYGTTGSQGALDVTSTEGALRYGASSYVQATSSGVFTAGDITLGQRVFAPDILTTTNAANLRHGNLGELLRVTSSSMRYKENIQNLNITPSLNANNLLYLPVRSFTYKEEYLSDDDDRFGQVVPGFIAEEVNEHYPIAVDYADGEINSWNERFIIPGMLSLIQDMHQEITELKSRLDALEQ
jgi:hypothetical protein